ncbi:macrolide transport system ATP-binding/permease protein [Nonomuraea fuscirosea]|uniref:Macrolide transport system ATP-binding/permease protein n=1 Tax=Nonomuraea fuscirosea TaxID=1291556 RepID=A0A2T0N3F6_9ACTN|nr:macrolide transport system ATP-binding/permease protein [Nonomuraea fuscirosea]
MRSGERAGIVGENGSGKSTLLRLIAGVERPDDGEVRVEGDFGHLGQTLGLPPEHTVQQAVDAALADLRAMERRMRELESALTDEVMDEYGELMTAYELRGGYEADARVERAFHGLGLAHVSRDRRLSSLSGGEQARLGLACVLAAAPRVLLLDEPTNHLDEAALTWLEERLREHRGTVAVVSHDRVFLDRVATVILEVEHGTVTRFGGGYTGYLTAKAAARARWEQAYAAWREEIHQVREHAATTAHRVAAGRLMRDNNKMAYDRNAGRVQSSVASRVRNAHERLRRLEANPVPRPPTPLHFQAAFTTTDPPPPAAPSAAPTRSTTAQPGHMTRPSTDQPGHAAQQSTDQPGHAAQQSTDQPGHAAQQSTERADDAAARDATPEAPAAHSTTREATTAPVLVELRDVRVADRLQIDSLTIRAGDRLLLRGANGAGKSTLMRILAERAGCRVGYLPQEVTFDPDHSVLEAYGIGYADERGSALLNTGLFRPHTLSQRTGELSVGQRRRLALARLLAEQHDLLLLDEPTNHLSPVLAEELERALDGYDGATVVVSHDRALLRRFRGKEIELVRGRLR